MADYKVPQDVEADDKLIGPFSFRQFIYLIIVAIAIAIGWGLSRLFVPLAIIPLPVILFFGALALPLRKDQPMEIYMAAIVSFYLKPRKRLWQADGIQSLVEITAPKVVEVQRAKDISQTEAQQRLSYLADIVDTGGWAVRGVAMPEAPSAMQSDVYFEAQQAEDILDSNGGVARSFDNMISQSDQRRHQEVIERMHQSAVASQPPATSSVPDPYAAIAAPTVTPSSPANQTVAFNPYPTNMHQHVINPLGSVAQPAHTTAAPQASPPPTPPPQPVATQPAITTSEKQVSPDIINLANNADLSIETIAHEANRIRQHEQLLADDEVVISLR